MAARALVHYHLERQRAMMGKFLDALGITHDNGLITEENVSRPDRERMKAAVADLASSHPPEDVGPTSRRSSPGSETWRDLRGAEALRVCRRRSADRRAYVNPRCSRSLPSHIPRADEARRRRRAGSPDLAASGPKLPWRPHLDAV